MLRLNRQAASRLCPITFKFFFFVVEKKSYKYRHRAKSILSIFSNESKLKFEQQEVYWKYIQNASIVWTMLNFNLLSENNYAVRRPRVVEYIEQHVITFSDWKSRRKVHNPQTINNAYWINWIWWNSTVTTINQKKWMLREYNAIQ